MARTPLAPLTRRRRLVPYAAARLDRPPADRGLAARPHRNRQRAVRGRPEFPAPENTAKLSKCPPVRPVRTESTRPSKDLRAKFPRLSEQGIFPPNRKVFRPEQGAEWGDFRLNREGSGNVYGRSAPRELI